MSNPVTDLKHELLAAAERQQRAPAPVSGRRFRGFARAPRILPIGTAVAVAAAAALFFTAPWSGSTGSLERAAAALSPPRDSILHVTLVETTNCPVRWTAQVWIDERTYTNRGLFRDPFLPYPFRYFTRGELSQISCLRGTTYEAGVVLGPRDVCCGPHNTLLHSFVSIRFVPPNRLFRLRGTSALPLTFGRVPALDPVESLRRAIRAGRARDLGKSKLDGRTVERIHFGPCLPSKPDLCPDNLADAGGYAYVDPVTYYPIEIRLDGAGTTRFSEYEYLPRTAANLALTNIRAEHPRAQLSQGR